MATGRSLSMTICSRSLRWSWSLSQFSTVSSSSGVSRNFLGMSPGRVHTVRQYEAWAVDKQLDTTLNIGLIATHHKECNEDVIEDEQNDLLHLRLDGVEAQVDDIGVVWPGDDAGDDEDGDPLEQGEAAAAEAAVRRHVAAAHPVPVLGLRNCYTLLTIAPLHNNN